MASIKEISARRKLAAPIVGLGLATACSPTIDTDTVSASFELAEAIELAPEECSNALFEQLATEGVVDPLATESCNEANVATVRTITEATENAPKEIEETILFAGGAAVVLVFGGSGIALGKALERRSNK